MSSREWIFRIGEILKAVEKIEHYLKGMTLTQFKKNELVVDAFIRNLEIIGEASKNIPLNIRRSYSNIPWDLMYGMRNILIHEYFGVDMNVVWHTAKEHLPTLQKELQQIYEVTKK